MERCDRTQEEEVQIRGEDPEDTDKRMTTRMRLSTFNNFNLEEN